MSEEVEKPQAADIEIAVSDQIEVTENQ